MENETEVPVVETETPNDTTDYKTLHEESQTKVKELEWLIQKHKTKKPDKQETTWMSAEDVKAMLREEKFYETNPDMLEHREKIAEYTSKGLTETQASKLIVDEDPTIANRKTAQNTNFTAWDSAPNVSSSFTREQLENMTQREYNNAKDLIDTGKAILK